MMTAQTFDVPERKCAAMSRARGALVVYLAALAQGLTVVSFPASGALFKARGFTDAQYGALFLPQVAFTLLASLLGARVVGRLGLSRLLSFASSASLLAAVLLFCGSIVPPRAAFPILLAGTAAMGTGFGLSAAPLNTLPPRLFPNRGDASLLALHTLMGSGFALGPWLTGEWIRAGTWRELPLGLVALNLLLSLAAGPLLRVFDQRSPESHMSGGTTRFPGRAPALWGFVAVAVIYAFAEGTFSNWGLLFLHEERGLPEASAGVALSIFWGALVVGRLSSAFLVVRISPRRLWLVLPTLMAIALACVPLIGSRTSAFAVFAVAGLSCSALFPLTVTLASRQFPEHAAPVSSAMIASLMFGVGLASFSIGPLRHFLSLAQIFRASMAYPLRVLVLQVAISTGISRPTTGRRRA